MKDDAHFVVGNQVIHSKTGKSVKLKKGLTPVVVHKGEIIVTGNDVKRVKSILNNK